MKSPGQPGIAVNKLKGKGKRRKNPKENTQRDSALQETWILIKIVAI